jgi:hypothetical protein
VEAKITNWLPPPNSLPPVDHQGVVDCAELAAQHRTNKRRENITHHEKSRLVSMICRRATSFDRHNLLVRVHGCQC